MGAKAETDDEDMCRAAQAEHFTERLTTGAEWGQCLEVSVVLVNDGVLSGDVPEDNHGKYGQRCVRAEHFTGDGISVEKASDCPRGWNCNSDDDDGVHACRNGLYCNQAGTCDPCSSCPPDGSCGNCRTTFYPRVDDYSVLRLTDYCDRTSHQDTCNGWMGCMWAGGEEGKCLPGPIPSSAQGDHLSLTKPQLDARADHDKHIIFTPNQEFYVEMGRDGVGNGVVRSPIVVFAQDNVEVAAMYLKLGMVHGFPRKIAWEQTHAISSSCGDPGGTTPAVKYTAKRSNLRPHMLAKCASVDGHCADNGGAGGVTLWPMTDCGFSTLEGYYKDKKFHGMQWVGPPPKNETIDGGPPDDCTQDMCGITPAKDGEVAPVQIYPTWMGTDKNDRDMTSGGLTYESFQQYSAFEAAKDATDVAKALAEKSRKCVTSKDC